MNQGSLGRGQNERQTSLSLPSKSLTAVPGHVARSRRTNGCDGLAFGEQSGALMARAASTVEGARYIGGLLGGRNAKLSGASEASDLAGGEAP